MEAYTLAVSLVADPYAAYQHPTDALERAAAVLRSLYGGGPAALHFDAMRRAEYSITATIRARRQLDVMTPAAPVAPQAPVTPPVGGARVRATRSPVPSRPPSTAHADFDL